MSLAAHGLSIIPALTIYHIITQKFDSEKLTKFIIFSLNASPLKYTINSSNFCAIAVRYKYWELLVSVYSPKILTVEKINLMNWGQEKITEKNLTNWIGLTLSPH